jgi:outer membrane immunogenic protein
MSCSSLKSRFLVAPLAAASLGLVVAGSARAADLPMRYKAPPFATQVFNWTGFYLGGQVGYASGHDQLFEYFTASGAFTGFQKRNNVSGVTGGGFFGANYQTGMVVVGLEGDVEGSDLTGGWIDLPTGGQGRTKIDFQSSLRGRIGLASDRAMVYATGGAAFGNVAHTYTNLLTGVSETFSGTRTGWTVGGGVEFVIAPNWLARAEYRYTDYGMSRASSVTSFPGLTGTQEVKLNTIRVGFAYKF